VRGRITWSCCERAVMNTDLSISSGRAVEELYAEPPAAYLDPDVLSDEAKKAAEAFEVEGTSPNTRRTYRRRSCTGAPGMRCGMGRC
jgi:hypothetical protein